MNDSGSTTHATPSPARRRKTEVAIAVAIAGATAIYVLASNHVIPFSNDFHCDPWYYFGLFYLMDHATTILGGRQLSRLPLVLPGYATTHLFPAAFADYATFLLLYGGSWLGIYFSLRRLGGAVAALIAATFFGFNPIVLGNLAVTFTSPSMLYVVIAVWLCCRAQLNAGLSRFSTLALAGGVLGFAIHGHLYAIVCGCVAPLYAMRWERGGFAKLLGEGVLIAIPVAIGLIAATLALGAVNVLAFGGRFLFFERQLEAIGTVDFVDYQLPGWYWSGARGAVATLGLAVAAAQLALAWIRPRTNGGKDVRLIFGVPLAFAAAFAFIDAWLGGVFLQYDYYYVFLIPVIALSVGALAASAREARGAAAVAIAYLLVAAAAALPTIETITRYLASPDNGVFALAAVAVAALAALLALAATPRLLPLAILVASLIPVELAFKPQRFGRQAWMAAARSDAAYGAANYLRIRTAMEFLSAFRFPTTPVFWVSVDNGDWETIALPRSYLYCVVDMHLPRLETDAREMTAGRYLVLVHSDAALVDLANTVLAERGLRAEEISRHKIASGAVSYYVVIAKLVASSNPRQ